MGAIDYLIDYLHSYRPSLTLVRPVRVTTSLNTRIGLPSTVGAVLSVVSEQNVGCAMRRALLPINRA